MMQDDNEANASTTGNDSESTSRLEDWPQWLVASAMASLVGLAAGWGVFTLLLGLLVGDLAKVDLTGVRAMLVFMTCWFTSYGLAAIGFGLVYAGMVWLLAKRPGRPRRTWLLIGAALGLVACLLSLAVNVVVFRSIGNSAALWSAGVIGFATCTLAFRPAVKAMGQSIGGEV